MIIIALKRIFESLKAVSSKGYLAEEVSKEDVPSIEQVCVGTSTSAFRFFLLLKVIDMEGVKIFKVYNNADRASHATSYRYDIVLVTSDGLLATTSQSFQAYGLPDESIWALWFLGYIQVNTVMHISSHWFRKNMERLQSIAVSDDSVGLFNILSNSAIATGSKDLVNTSNKHAFSKCVELSKGAWDKVVGTLTSSTSVPKTFAADMYRSNYIVTSSIDCYSKDWHRANCIKAIGLYQKGGFEFQMELAKLVEKEYLRQTCNEVSSKSFEVQLSSSSQETKKLKSVSSTSSIRKRKQRFKPGI